MIDIFCSDEEYENQNSISDNNLSENHNNISEDKYKFR